MLDRTLNFMELYHTLLPTQVMWALNIPVRKTRFDILVLSVISNSFLSSKIVLFFILVSQALALGDKQVKYFFSFNSLTLSMCHTLTSNGILSTAFFCCQFCFPGCFSGEKDQYSCLSNIAELQHAALLSLCSWLHLPFLSWSHQQLLLTFLQELPSAIFCYILPDKSLSRWLAESLTPFW